MLMSLAVAPLTQDAGSGGGGGLGFLVNGVVGVRGLLWPYFSQIRK